MREYLSKQYYDPSTKGSYYGAETFKRSLNKPIPSTTDNWLSEQDAYTLHRTPRRKFPRRQTLVGGIDHQWQADLNDLSRLKRYNDGNVFVLTVIDVFSKRAEAVPLKNKTGSSLVKAFAPLLEGRRPPLKLQTDKGTEFTNKTFQTFLKDKGVDFFTTHNDDVKASVVERFNRTLKERLWRYFTANDTKRYVDVLPALVSSYNNTYHRSIGRSPASVNPDNQEDVWQRLYGKTRTTASSKLKVGDRVRISNALRQFKKGYLPSWTREVFTIDEALTTSPTTYVLKDDSGERVKGSFYSQELQKVTKELYNVEKVIRTRKRKGRPLEALVRWEGYSDAFDSWIPRTSIIRRKTKQQQQQQQQQQRKKKKKKKN